MQENSEIIFIEMTAEKYRSELEKASALGAMLAMQACGISVKEYLSRAELSRRFGKGKIDRMISAGKLMPYSMDGGRPKYKLTEVLTTIK